MMNYAKQKKLGDQVIVITGASSGIGLATAKMAARRGAKVVLSSFDEEALKRVTEKIQSDGGDASYFTADVSKEEEAKALARAAVDKYGRIDTWINNAGIHSFGKIEDVALKDANRIFDVNFWGIVHGSRAAIPYLRKSKGSLINIGSVLSSHAVPLQGYYCASKHAVKGYTNSLRMELEAKKIPVAISLVKPSAIHTPISLHSKNILDQKVQLPPPHYAPEVAAKGILSCAEVPRRELVIGGAGKLGIIGEKFGPFFADTFMKMFLYKAQRAEGRPRRQTNLYEPLETLPRTRGKEKRFVMESSLYTWMETHPWTVAIGSFATAALATAVMGKRKEFGHGLNL